MNLHRYSRIAKDTAATLLLTGVLLLAGCATVPEPLRGGPQQSPDPAQVRAEPDQYAGVAVRWGGIIVNVENGPTQSEMEVVSRPLGDDARPLDTDQTSGRFLARINGFIDPMDYATGREITVVGVVKGVEQRNIGSHSYRYPIVEVTSQYLWPLSLPPMPDYYYYSPYYDPWYPFGPFYYPYYYSYPYSYPAYPYHPRGAMPPRQRLPQTSPQIQPPPQQLPQPRLPPQPRQRR